MEDNQVPAQDPIVTLYDNLKDEYELSDFETFKNDLSDPANVSKLHGALAADGFDIPDLDTFSMDLGVKKKDVAGETLPEVVVTASSQSTPPSSPTSVSTSASDPLLSSSGVSSTPEEPIYQLLNKRKAASEKKAARLALNNQSAPGAVPAIPVDNTDVDGEILSTETKIKDRASKLGFKVENIDDFFKDIDGLKSSSLSDETLQQLFANKDTKPKTYSRQIANLKWRDAVRSAIKSEKPEDQPELMNQFDYLVNDIKSGGYGEGTYNEALAKGQRALETITRLTAGNEEARNTAIENFKADFIPTLGRHIISDPSVAKTIAASGGTYETKVTQDLQSIFDKPLADQNKMLNESTFESVQANEGKQRRQADNENIGLGIIASGVSDYYEGNLEEIKAANKFLDENKEKLKTLSDELNNYKGPDADTAKAIASLQKMYSRELSVFKEMKDLVESGKGTREDKSFLGISMMTLNNTAKRINGLAEQSADPAIQNKLKEYNSIAQKVEGFAKDYKKQDVLSQWNQYIENKKNTQFQRYPVKAIDQELEDRQNYYGSNTNALEKAAINVAEFGRSSGDFLSMVYENMFYDPEKQLEADFERIGRDDADRSMINYETESQSLRQRPFVTVYSDDIKAKLDAVNNDDKLSKEEKYKRSYKLFTEGRKNGSIYTTTNQNAGDYNITAKSVLNTVASVMPQIASQYAFAFATGGAGAASALRSTAGLVTGTFLQGYSQYHTQAVKEGIANPDQYAFGHSLIDALTEGFSIKDFEMLKKVGANLKGGAGKFVQDLTEKQYKKLMDGSLKTFEGLGKTIRRNLGSNFEEAFVEETSAQLLGNVFDNAAFNKNVDILEGVADAGVTTSIGMLPMTLLGIPIAYNKANIGNKYQFYAAGQNPSESIAAIQEQLKNGDISQVQADERIAAVNAIAATIKNMPKMYADGKPMRDDHKAEYAFNQFIIDRSKTGLNSLPAEQQESVKKTVAEAEAANGKILANGGFVKAGPELSKIENYKPEDFAAAPTAEGYAAKMTAAKESLGADGITVDVYGQEDYDQIAKEGGQFVSNEDGTAMGALKPNGEIVSIVKAKEDTRKGAAPALLEKMKQLGGLFMDNFDIYLTKQYEKAGFKVVARVPFNEEFAPEGWQDSPLKDKPDVVFMARAEFAPAQEKSFADYNEAKAYTEGLAKAAVEAGTVKSPSQVTTEFADNVIDKATKNAPVTGVKFTVTADTPVDLPNVTVKSPIHKKVLADINQAAKALAKTGIKFKVYDNEDAFSTESGQDKATQGVFIDEDGTISINLAAIKNSKDWNIAWHEASHPVMNIIRNTNRPLYNKMANGLAQLAKIDKNAAAVVTWSENNYEGKETKVDEAGVETIGLMADGTIDFDKVPLGTRQAIIDFINEIAKYLGLDPILNDTDKATFIKKAKEISNALKTGADISTVVGAENVKEYQNNLDTPEVMVAGQMKNNPQARLSETPAINVYESKETEKLPVRSIEDVYNKFDGKAVAINSDPTKVGELTLPSGKKIFMYGGPAYLSLKDNVDAGVGFATTQPSKVKTWSTYLKSVFGDKDGVTLVTTQAPTSMMANSYSLRYVLDAISTLPKSILKSKEFKDEFFGKDLVLLKDAFGEKGYNDFVNKYKKADLSDSKVIDGMIAEMAYKVGDDNKPASFKARGAFVGNLLGGIALKADIKGVEGDKGYVSKKPTKFIAKQLFDRLGLNQEKLFYEIGEKSLVDLYMNEGKWGMAVAGFETKAGTSIDQAQAGGVKHPLFNAKFPGSDAFLLDGAYEIDKLFAPQDIISSGGNPYTKSAAQMLAGSMYVMGDKTKGEKSFEYKPSPISGKRIQQKKSAVVLAEMESIVKTAKENGTYLKAPNGKATKLNPDQWAEVRTNNFKNWFGDWEKDPANASKVMDGNGEPRVVFHGTNANFDEFKKESLGSKNWMADSAYMGFFFAGDKKTSEAYTGMNSIDMAGVSFGVYDDIINKYKPELDKASKAVSETYNTILAEEEAKAAMGLEDSVKALRDQGLGEDLIQDLLKSLKDLRTDLQKVSDRAKEANDRNGNNDRLSEINKNIYAEIDAAWRQKTGANPKIMELFLNVRNPLTVDYSNVEETELPKNIQEAIGTGKDGVVFNNLKDGAEADDIFVAFEPNQIKSATDNTGEFSKASNKIQQKVGKVELPAATQKQMTEDDKGNYLFYHYSDKNIKKIDPNKFGSNTNATGRDERPGVGISMYYTRPDVKEQNVPSEFGYVVRVPKGKVYPFNQDPLNLIEPAKRMFEKQYPGQAFDPNKQVAWVSKAAAGRGYPMTVAEWNIGRKKLLRAQTTEALKPEVYSKVKPGTLNQVETNPALEKFKPNAKRVQAKIGGGLSVEDLKDFNSLPNANLAEGNNYVPLSRFGITDLTGENVKTVAEKLAEVEGPYQPIFKAISKMPKADKVEMYNLGQTANIFNQSGGMVAGLYSPPRTFLDKPVIGIATDIYANQYSATAHEMMHWVTIDSVNKNKGTTEYKALEDIYKFLKAKHPDIVGEKASGAYYGLQNFKEFMAELLTNKDFRDNMAGIMAKDKNEFRETVYGYNQSTSGDIINTLINYVQKVIRDLMDKWGKGIDFNKSMIDNATDLAVKAFFKDQVGGAQLSKGGANIDADTRKSVANMLGKLSDEDVAKILQDEKGLTEEEAMEVIEDVKFDPALNPTVSDIVGEVEEGERARGLSKTFPDRGADTIAKINSDAKKYFVVSNKQTAAEAQAFIDEKNPEDALDYLLTQPTDIPNRVRIWMSGAVMDKIDTAINEAQLKGDKETAQRLTDKQAQLVNQVAPLGTELGQAIQAFRRFYENSKGSPSMLQFYIKKITDQVESEKGNPLTDEERKNIVDLAKQVQSAEDGLPKDEAVYALGNYVSSIVPVSATDLMEAIWYAHILSGITTQSTNFFANLWNSFAEGAVVGTREAIKTKSVMPFINGIQGFLSGIKQGANDAADIIKTGVGKQDGDKYKQGNILEFFSWKQIAGEKAGKVLDWAGGFSPKLLKYVGRALAATDAAFSRANSEAISRVMAYNIAKEEGKQNPDIKINQRVDELLNKTAEKKAEAQDKAKAEGYLEGTTRYRRRVGEILEAGRSKELKKEADEFGKRVTLNYEPEGFMRPVYKLALAMQQSTKLTRMFIPFTRIVVNLTENALNYTPLGLVKTAVGSTNTEGGRRKLTKDERADFAIKATIGLSTFVMLSGLTGDDDDDMFDVTANGSGDPQKNYELMKSGWRPYSIKTKDGRYISYKDWPVAPVLAAVGAMHDSAKYNSSDEPTNEATIAAAAMVISLYDKSVMKGIQDFVEVINPKQEYNQSSKFFDRLISWGSDQAKTMAVTNFTQQAIKFSREAMDSPIKAAKGVERIYRDIPYLNDGLNPILDVFGEPVTPSTSEKLLPITVGKPSKDEVLAAFNENGIYIGKPKTRDLYVSSDPSNEETRPMTDEEYYQYTKRSGQITKQYIMEDWNEIKEILAIPDRKTRKAELKAYTTKLLSDAREEALSEFPNQ